MGTVQRSMSFHNHEALGLYSGLRGDCCGVLK